MQKNSIRSQTQMYLIGNIETKTQQTAKYTAQIQCSKLKGWILVGCRRKKSEMKVFFMCTKWTSNAIWQWIEMLKCFDGHSIITAGTHIYLFCKLSVTLQLNKIVIHIRPSIVFYGRVHWHANLTCTILTIHIRCMYTMILLHAIWLYANICIYNIQHSKKTWEYFVLQLCIISTFGSFSLGLSLEVCVFVYIMFIPGAIIIIIYFHFRLTPNTTIHIPCVEWWAHRTYFTCSQKPNWIFYLAMCSVFSFLIQVRGFTTSYLLMPHKTVLFINSTEYTQCSPFDVHTQHTTYSDRGSWHIR